MTLKDLLLKYDFDTLTPDLILADNPAKDNLFAFKEAFDEQRRMEPRDSHEEQIVVDFEVETDEDGIETNRYLYASNCEGDLWEDSLAKEVIIKADVSETRALAQILWHMTFYGFSRDEDGLEDNTPLNLYERKAKQLEYRQFCNYARIKCKRNPDEHDLLCALPSDEWDIYNKREAHRNRAKRMRDARQTRSIDRLERKGKITRLEDRLLKYACDYGYGDIKYLESSEKICVYEFYSRTRTQDGRVEYILENMKKYFNTGLLKAYTGFTFILEYPEHYPVVLEEVSPLTKYLLSITSFAKSSQRIHFGVTQGDSYDIHLFVVCSVLAGGLI